MNSGNTPCISVIITCYNHAVYLPQAIESILAQTYPHHEIIVVDDGSQDDTASVAQRYPQVKYIWQQNQGLGAARNTGAAHAKGVYFIFLDADDWLYEQALEVQVAAIEQLPHVAAIAAGHYKVTNDGTVIHEEENNPVYADHYLDLLQGNFIGMHAAVMYRRSVFDEFKYDPSLKAAEDYDLYLKLTRKHTMHVHKHIVAAYRIHGNNMSRNIPMMLAHVLKVHERQHAFLRSDEEKKAYNRGIEIWNEYYTDVLIKHKQMLLQSGSNMHSLLTRDEATLLKKNRPAALYRLYLLLIKNKLKSSMIKPGLKGAKSGG